jgi:hypothetical protein
MGTFEKMVFILSTGQELVFTCRYRRDLERPNWHYYEKSNGKLIHLRKEHLMCVMEYDKHVSEN